MGIYIKGMEMPKTCRKCGFYHHSVDDGYYDFEYCGANNKEFNNAYDSTKPHINPFEEKLSTCPLVPVPPHGRLIDADALVKVLKRCAADDWNKEAHPFSWSYAYECEINVVEGMPAIIPAEEGET